MKIPTVIGLSLLMKENVKGYGKNGEKGFAAIIALLSMVALIAACGMEESTESEDGINVATVEQAMGTPKIHISETITKNGNFLEESVHNWIGGDCTDGYRRATTDEWDEADEKVTNPTVQKLWHGWCNFIAWENPSDPTNCKGLFETKSAAGGGNARCIFTIYEEKMEPQKSCQFGREKFCDDGGHSLDGTCYCDRICVRYGDCCDDYEDVCLFR